MRDAVKLRYFNWDGSPTVVAGDVRARFDLDETWKVGSAEPVLSTAWRDAPEMTRAELAALFPGVDLADGERLLTRTCRAAE